MNCDTITKAALSPYGTRLVDAPLIFLVQLRTGHVEYVRSVRANFTWYAEYPLSEPADNITVCRPTSLAIGNYTGAFVRVNVPDPSWSLRPASQWVVNTSTGHDENEGDASAPLRSWAECQRRTGRMPDYAALAYRGT